MGPDRRAQFSNSPGPRSGGRGRGAHPVSGAQGGSGGVALGHDEVQLVQTNFSGIRLRRAGFAAGEAENKLDGRRRQPGQGPGRQTARRKRQDRGLERGEVRGVRVERPGPRRHSFGGKVLQASRIFEQPFAARTGYFQRRRSHEGKRGENLSSF